MTTASDGGFRRRLDGITAWATHASIWIGVVCALPSTVLYILHPWTPLPTTWWTLAPSGLIFITYIAIFIHEYKAMCMRCMEDVPADAAIRATREGGWDRRWLRFYHWNMLSWLIFAVVTPILIAFTNLWAIDIVWYVQVIMLVTSWRYHRLLRPWCPFCRHWGGGGDREVVPDPDPVMTKELT